jgi:hypothetical protein
MEIFRTAFVIPNSEKKINYQSPIMLIGSCFSEYVGNKLSDSKLMVDNNPFGIVYNPLSVKSGLMRLIDSRPYSKEELFNHEGVWGSFDHHSRFSDLDPESTLLKINDRLTASSVFIRKANFLFLTFGTAYVYNLKSSGKIVSNCHKFESSEFIRTRLNVEQIVTEYDLLIHQLNRINPNLEIVFTVSPIRHWKDGAHENQLSKSILLLAIDHICTSHKNTLYFPSYELIMDDLRDYRFYEEDMLHPNKIAINYIWSRFRECFLENDVISIMKEVEKVILATRHKPFNPKAESFQAFVHQQLDKIRYLKNQYSISFDEEEKQFLQYLGK